MRHYLKPIIAVIALSLTYVLSIPSMAYAEPFERIERPPEIMSMTYVIDLFEYDVVPVPYYSITLERVRHPLKTDSVKIKRMGKAYRHQRQPHVRAAPIVI